MKRSHLFLSDRPASLYGLKGETCIMGLKDAINGVLDKTDIDEKIKENPAIIKDKVQEVLDKTDIDEKIMAKFKKDDKE